MNEQTATTEMGAADILDILAMIPHRYPLLLVDKVIDMVPGESATGIKNVTMNEPHFQGHFPGKPIMPGVMIVEAMAQTSAVLVVHTLGDEGRDKLVYFMSIDNAKFRKLVVPGDRMYIYLVKERQRGSVWKFSAVAKVDDEVVAEATFTAMIVDPEEA
ncbi:MAG: 3-hydroxyacyl-ACP dehydratase FabZ [Alphaproteobacteria bacterium]|jgi:3-hydroxyacyl-[acyl-carrier-protein] dehydratase|nr:3-hydroxyacyl-ACP dehydratase FabZ [Alphaproteobacteria bacterium]MBT4016429.1 3-hydroxyacyl-ACP dehydratase FabZ [Alphaproteobacteria bacterium]MBT4965979.1 3-hydroxyacyl-ACP dehydratase FabZ [Alphaproteobacteria bacterium]MBT5160418.1 3-hydroxyacyl-ACP dehydratase FabZ [Alphaproteobacteria bacterium]MBT5919236.1 3-hydroxyacyl-ACP dehydratase FabZ [Alphaproteobacteria bacterium]